MAEGKNGTWVIRSLVGFLFLIAFSAMTTIYGNVSANEKDCRNRGVKQDEKLQEQNEKLHVAVLEQQQQNAEINVTLEKMLITLEYIKNGR